MEEDVLKNAPVPGSASRGDDRVPEGKGLFKASAYGAEFLPMLDISRGGIRFLSQEMVELDTPIHLSIQVPGDPAP